MKIWKVILATLVIFGTGVITGGLLVGIADGARERRHHWFEIHTARLLQTVVSAPTNAMPEATNRLPLPLANPPRRVFPKDFLERLDRELKLTAEQHQQIDQILDDGQKRAKEIWDRVTPELRTQMKLSRDKIRDLLTPDQKARFEELMKARPPKPPKESLSKNNLPPALPESVSTTNPPAAQP